ncbi:CR1-alpha [simian adenovirus 2]|uniref:CR1-alpha n=1 Tax=simian adenovirus 2 TaxID=38418 RepID=A0A679A5J8_9ADEN|nr:CR1-alpha [Simian adenovirus 2]
MKICVVIFALSLIKTELFAAPSTPRVVPKETTSFSPRGIIQTVYFDNSTTLLTLNCSCTNELIQWIANGVICITFLNSAVFHQRNNSLCGNTTLHTLTLTPPFAELQYFCIGVGKGPSCWHRSFLKKAVPSTISSASAPNNSTSLNFTRSAYLTTHTSWQPVVTLTALILLVLFNFVLIEYLVSL